MLVLNFCLSAKMLQATPKAHHEQEPDHLLCQEGEGGRGPLEAREGPNQVKQLRFSILWEVGLNMFQIQTTAPEEAGQQGRAERGGVPHFPRGKI